MRQNIIAGFCWLIISGLLVAGIVACGLFKKDVRKDYNRAVSEVVDKSVTRERSNDRSKLKEQDILEIEIRRPATPVPDISDTTNYESLNEAIMAAIRDADHLSLRLSALREESQSLGQIRGENRDYSHYSDTTSKTKAAETEGNTTLISNVPWYAWVFGIGGVLGLAYLVMKRYGVL